MENIAPISNPRGPRPKTHCKHRHELTGNNVKQLFYPSGKKAGRMCMECNRIAHRKYYAEDIESRKEKVRKHRKDNPDSVKSSVLKKKYGITLEDYNGMFSAQEGKCALCGSADPGRKNSMFSVDHCHSTGVVRKLLCTLCNVALGAAKDNPALLRKMADYIESYREVK